MARNPGFDASVVQAYKERCRDSPFGFVAHPEEERTPEYFQVYFTGIYEGREVVYDAAFYTLRLHHESELYSMAEDLTREKFPDFYSDDKSEDTNPPEEVAMYLAGLVLDLEEEESVRVKEHADIDPDADFGVVLDVGLHVAEITDERIAGFIRDFNAGVLKLDPTLYAFQHNDPGDA